MNLPSSASRKAAFDAIAVERGERLIARQSLQNVDGAVRALESSAMSKAPCLVFAMKPLRRIAAAGGLAERRREQVAVAVGPRVGLQVLDPREAADVDARRLPLRICSRRRLARAVIQASSR